LRRIPVSADPGPGRPPPEVSVDSRAPPALCWLCAPLVMTGEPTRDDGIRARGSWRLSTVAQALDLYPEDKHSWGNRVKMQKPLARDRCLPRVSVCYGKECGRSYVLKHGRKGNEYDTERVSQAGGGGGCTLDASSGY
jgi:hypothetical protein